MRVPYPARIAFVLVVIPSNSPDTAIMEPRFRFYHLRDSNSDSTSCRTDISRSNLCFPSSIPHFDPFWKPMRLRYLWRSIAMTLGTCFLVSASTSCKPRIMTRSRPAPHFSDIIGMGGNCTTLWNPCSGSGISAQSFSVICGAAVA